MSEEAAPYDALVQRRQENIGRYFWRAHRAFVEISVRKMAARGHSGLAPAHATLISHIDTQGTRITALAERMFITKQAAGHLVADLVEKGYIASAPDPSDRRAVLVTFTDMGWRFLQDAYELKGEIEAEFTGILGKERYEQLRETLNDLLTHIEDDQKS
ncbi:MarR family winged helix-turn-helix transcriptional regulator [Dictyobacter aurantiacus]|uniref:Transcriptional regulator n=1 Tax=Dictyobacter aurantiacus TaxID=1936993 RepID=A0A401ZN98_9CHLR|nr:MarR family winged helix-turn-helix transcriptional regulator [Dictyobacter aurantiacus]GCE08294.1 transcriptional regulator [Dictyobacter aurantiacus]